MTNTKGNLCILWKLLFKCMFLIEFTSSFIRAGNVWFVFLCVYVTIMLTRKFIIVSSNFICVIKQRIFYCMTIRNEWQYFHFINWLWDVQCFPCIMKTYSLVMRSMPVFNVIEFQSESIIKVTSDWLVHFFIIIIIIAVRFIFQLLLLKLISAMPLCIQSTQER